MSKKENVLILADDSHNLLYFLLLFPICVVEAVVFIWPMPLFILLHLSLCGVLALLVYLAFKRDWDMRLPLLLWIAIAFFGPLGCLANFCFFIFYGVFKLFSTPFDQWYASLFSTMQLTPASRIYERIMAGWDDYETQREVISFQDLMQVGTLEQKQGVLEMIAQNFNPLLAPVLKNALEDRDNLIRVHAAAIIAKIDRDFEEKRKVLEGELKKDPDDPANLLAIAAHLDNYAFSGVVDFFREKESRELAIDYYKKYIEHKPDDHTAWMALGRLLNRLQAFDQVAQWFEERLQKHEKIPAASYPWYWEALFMLQSYNVLSESAQKAYNELVKTASENNLLECVQLWINREK